MIKNDRSMKKLLGCGCGVVAVVVLLVVVAAMVGFYRWSAGASRRAEGALARIRAKGEPTSPEEVDDYYPVTPEQRDAARVRFAAVEPFESAAFNAATEGLPIFDYGDDVEEIPPAGEPWPQLEAIEQFLRQYQAQLDLLHEAAAGDQPARYLAEFRQVLVVDFPCRSLVSGAQLLSLEAHVRAHRGDPHGVTESILHISALGESFREEPLHLPQLTRCGINGVAIDLASELLPWVDFSDEDLSRLQAQFGQVDYRDGLRRAMIGERVIGIMVIRDPSLVGKPDLSRLPRAVRDENLVTFLTGMEQAIAATEKPWPLVLAETKRISGQLQLMKRDSTRGFLSNCFLSSLSGLLAPSVGAADMISARPTAQARSAAVGIAVERYRRRHGTLPEHLGDLVPEFLPEVPTDPFDGQPLRHVVRDDEYIVYSVGQDGKDDPDDANSAFRVRLRQ